MNDSNQVKKSGFISRNLFWLVLWTILIGFILLRVFVFQQVNVSGLSMLPTHQDQEKLLINQIHKETRNRGQVVAVYENASVDKNANYFTRFEPGTEFYLKRVIGLPGESIEIVKDKVIIYNQNFPNGKVLNEDYVSKETKQRQIQINYYFPKTKIPDGYYFLMGDNRNKSLDSREKGPFPNYSILGEEVYKYWPVENVQKFELPKYEFTDIPSDIQEIINNKQN